MLKEPKRIIAEEPTAQEYSIDFKIYIGGRIWQIKDNTITLIYGKKRCCNGGRQGKRNEIDFEIGAKTPAADRYA